MSATRLEISRWYDQGTGRGAQFLIIARDEFWDIFENYPVYADSEEEARKQVERLQGGQMSGVDEVYDLRRNKLEQMLAPSVWDLPAVAQ